MHTSIGEVRLSPDFPNPEGWVALSAYPTSAQLGEIGLVILAMGKAYWAIEYEGRYVLCVRSRDVSIIEAEISRYASLHPRKRPGGGAVVEMYPVHWLSFLLYAVVMFIGYFSDRAFGLSEIGRVDAQRMVEHAEWWRALTALTLHADVGHLVSNLAGGIGFGLLVCRLYGSGMAWVVILLTGFLGNAMNAWIYFPDLHYSIGASTAVFGALGILTGAAAIQVTGLSRESSPNKMQWIFPVLAGLTLLGLLGLGDGRVDVGAHFSGFFFGFLFGCLRWLLPESLLKRRRVQTISAVIILCLLIVPWCFAFVSDSTQ